MFRSVRLLSSPGIRKLHGNTQNAPKSRLVTITFALFSVATAYTVGSLYPIQPLALLFPAPAPPPLDASSPAGVEYMASLETSLLSLPFLTRLQSAPDKDQWYLTRPHASLPEDRRANHLTAGALRGPGRLATPVVWAKRDESEAFVILHLGRGLCGHDGIVHGGLLATLLDEVMARTAIMNFPERIGVTATLDVSYRAPTKADQFIVIHTKLDEVKGRKAFVSATAETLDGIRLVDATSMFVQPKYASLLNKTLVAQTLGASPQQSITSAPSVSGEVPVHLADRNITKTSK